MYPQAKAALPDAEMANIAQQFERFEEEETGSGDHARLHELAESLVASHTPQASAHGAEHGHSHPN